MTDQYVKRAKHVAEAQYKPLKSASDDNLAYFKVPQTGIDSLRSKLAFKIFDEYANILKGMYSTRFNGRQKNKGDHEANPTVMVIQQWSKQSFHPHHPGGVSDTLPDFFFFSST